MHSLAGLSNGVLVPCTPGAPSLQKLPRLSHSEPYTSLPWAPDKLLCPKQLFPNNLPGLRREPASGAAPRWQPLGPRKAGSAYSWALITDCAPVAWSIYIYLQDLTNQTPHGTRQAWGQRVRQTGRGAANFLSFSSGSKTEAAETPSPSPDPANARSKGLPQAPLLEPFNSVP